MKMNNIKALEDFFTDKRNKTIFINNVDEEKKCFYELLIREISKRYSSKLIQVSDTEKNNFSDNLFDTEIKIYTYHLTNNKQIEKVLNKNHKSIIFTDYKNYKKFFKTYQTINGYKFEEDVRLFISILFNINDENLINYCTEHPYLLFSELEKYKINEINYSVDSMVNQNSNFIMNIRRDIFYIKKSNIDVKELYSKLIEEVSYKKFNFLTY